MTLQYTVYSSIHSTNLSAGQFCQSDIWKKLSRPTQFNCIFHLVWVPTSYIHHEKYQRVFLDLQENTIIKNYNNKFSQESIGLLGTIQILRQQRGGQMLMQGWPNANQSGAPMGVRPARPRSYLDFAK